MTKKIAILLVLVAAFGVAVSAQDRGVKGKVRAQNGRGIPNATITVRLDGNDVKSATSNSKGEFSITGLASGKYNLAFEADGYSTGVLYGVEVDKGIRNLGDRLIMTPDKGTFVIVQGSIFSKEGASLPGAKIDLFQVNADGSTKKLGSTYSNTTGEFAFRRPAGIAKLRVSAKYKDIVASKDVEVDDAAVYRLAITIP